MWDGEIPDVCNVTYPKARKVHRCCECRTTIPAGHHYQHIRGLWDGTWSTYRTHLWCVAVRLWCEQHECHPHEYPVLGGLWECMAEIGETE